MSSPELRERVLPWDRLLHQDTVHPRRLPGSVLPSVTRTGDEEVPVLFQSFAVLANHVVQTQVQLVKGESLLRVGSAFSRRVVVGFLRKGVSRQSVATATFARD